MFAFDQAGFRRCRCAVCAVALAVSCGLSVPAAVQHAPVVISWQAALRARQEFEAAPAGSHTKESYARVMDGFRAIYHGAPGDPHAARAAEQVAELLAEQGRELADAKSLRAAAGQYEFLARAYPGGRLAPEALGHALDLLSPEAANDPEEARKVAAELKAEYPRSPEARGERPEVAAEKAAVPGTEASRPTAIVARTTVPEVSAPEVKAPAEPVPVVAKGPEARGPLAQVTGIRHWSTSSYTRVAIDLGDEVQYQAARVEHPDRIFFDLHHSRLAQELVGKSFAITDDGFLTRIRAAQFSNDVTRVVLDVHEVAEYSAFLLPNPYRLIIDIHGKPSGVPAEAQPAARVERTPERMPSPLAQYPGTPNAVIPEAQAGEAAPGVRSTPGSGSSAEVSALPPMPVTDGGGSFGLPAKTAAASAKGDAVPQPRVVIPSKPTAARPVPNSVSSRTGNSGAEVAAVSSQQGKVEATSRPTSQPIAARSDTPASGSANAAVSDHYQPPAHTRQRDAGSAPVAAAAPTAGGETLMRALGLKIGRIVIDAGHGGHDSGTLGVGGIQEKDVVLDVALRLGKLLHDRLGAEIVYTRADDTFIPLETRTAIANKAQADLFISVHANSSADASARGVEVYYLNFTSDPEAMRVAGRENAVSTQSVHELSDLVKKIALKDKIDESRELAADVDTSLYAGIAKGNDGLRNRGVKKAPFVVLIGANMPSVLAEISFVTNPKDAEQLQRPEYRERVAESLYGGVARYAAGINNPGLAPTKAKTGTTERAQR